MPLQRTVGGGEDTSVVRRYYFNGRIYTSYATYQTARARYAANQQRAAEAERQRQLALSQQRAVERARATARAAAQQRALQQRQRDLVQQTREQLKAELAERRRRAWLSLQKRARRLRALNRAPSTDANGNRISRQVRFSTQASQQERRAKQQLERQKRLKQAAKTGQYDLIFKDIRRRQKRTGGRRLDRELYTAANDAVAAEMRRAQNAWRKQVDRFYRLFEAEDWARANQLVGSEGFRSDQAAYVRFFGDGRKPGLGQRLAALQNEIARTQDRFIQRQLSIGAGFGSGSMSEKELRQAYQRFRREHLFVPGGPGGFQETTERGTFMSLNEWLRREAEAEHARLGESWQQAMINAKRTRDAGLMPIYGADGSVQFVSREQVSRSQQVRKIFLGGGVSESDFTRLVNDLSGPAAVSQAALKELMQLGTDAWRRDNADRLASIGRATGGTGRGIDAAWAGLNRENAAVQSFRRWLFESLTGQKMEGGLTGALSDIAFQPVAGDVLNALGTGLGGVGSLVRLFNSIGAGGRLTVPDIEFGGGKTKADGGLFRTRDLAGRELPVVGLDTSDPAKAKEAGAIRDLMAVIGDPNADLGRKLDAIRIYGTDFVEGDLGLIPQTLLDPLTFLSGAGLLRAGRLSVVRAGGLRAAALAPGATVRDFLKLSLPKHLGGLSPSRIAEMTERLSIARDLKKTYAEVAQMSDDELVDLARGTMSGSLKEAAKRGVWEKLLEAHPQRAQQIFAAVSREFEQRAGKLGRVISPQRLGEDLRYAQQALRRAEREARATQARQAVRATTDAQATAAAQLRAERARKVGALPVARVPGLSPADKAARTRLVREFEGAVQDRIAAAQQAVDAAKRLTESRERGVRQAAFGDFEVAVQRLRDLEGHPPGPNSPRVPGAIERHRADIDDFDRDHQFIDETPGFVGVSRQRVAEDLLYLRGQLSDARTRLAQASTPGQVTYWKARIKRLEAAHGYLGTERDALNGVNRTVKATVKQYADQAKELIRPQQVAAKALDAPASRAELARDLHVVATREVTEVIAPLSNREAASLSKVEAVFAKHVDLSDIDELDPLVQRFGQVDLLALADAVLSVEGAFGAVKDLQQVMYRAVLRSMREAKVGGGVVEFIAWRQRAHLSAAPMGIRAFRTLDKEVATAIKAARGWRAKGAIRVRKGKAVARQSAPDRGLVEIYAKLAALGKRNVPVTAYDSARYVLRKPLLRHETGRKLRRAAHVQAAATGGSVDEIFDTLREAERLREVTNNLEQFASRPGNRGLTPEEVYALFEGEMLDTDLRPVVGTLNSYQARVLAKAFNEVSGVRFGDRAGIARALGVNAPPLDNWAAARKWLVDNGHWSPRTADDIRSGQRVWSLDEERDFWMSRYGVEPEWVKADRLEVALESKEAYDGFMREVGRYDEDFERLAMMSDLKPEQVQDAIVWGGEGIAEARTYGEIRQWMIDRYGPLVAEGDELIRAPWLMDPRAREYRRYIRRVFGPDPNAVALRNALGIEFDEGLVKEGQVAALGRAVERAVDKRLTRLIKEGKADFDDAWLPQEQNAFVFDVVDHLLSEQSWRGYLDRQPIAGRVLDAIGTFWRAAITWTIAFPVANLIDAFGLKRLLLTATQNGFRPLSLVSREAREAIPSLRSIGMSRSATWYTRGRSGLVNMRDSQFSTVFRAREAVRGLAESPLRVSRRGEERLMLDFARTRFDDHYRALLDLGVPEESARIRAMAQARRLTEDWFPGLEGASTFERAINQIVPFLSYNIRTKVLSITKFGLQNPWLLLVTQRLGDFIEEMNRKAWEAEHDEPFDAADPRARRLQIRIGDFNYAIDLSVASDWTRGLSTVFESHDPAEWAYEFFRAPHPSQSIFLAVAFGYNGGKTPWGTEARWEDVSVWFDFASWAMGNDAFSPDNPKGKDAVQAWSQLLTFKAFSRINPVTAKVQQYFAFRQISPDKAREYLRDNPDLAAYFALTNPEGGERSAAYEAAMAEYNALKASFDAKLDEYYLTPWSPEYAEWKKRRRGVLAGFIASHPILSEVWGLHRTPKEFAEEMDGFLVDGMVDQFFAMDKTRPQPDDYKTELEYAKALDSFFDARRLWLEAHPKVYDRLYHSRNVVEQAWRDQELHWSEILDRQADVRIRLLEEEAKGSQNDAAIEALHALSEANYLMLDAEAFGSFYDLLDVDRRNGKDLLTPRFALADQVSSLLGRVRSVVAFPGRGDYIYGKATPQERRKIDRRDAYVKAITSFVDGLKDPRLFWSELAKRPDLLKDYLRRNPERQADFTYATRIGAIIRASTSGKDFYDRLNADPWLRGEYFRRHPDKAAAYQANGEYMSWMKRWVRAIDRGGFADADQVWESMPAWVRDRYLAGHPDSGMHFRGGKAYRFDGKFFKSADSRQRYVEGAQYFGAMERWVGLLRQKQYDQADRFFRNLPDWIRERYFAKHPDDRARFELDGRMLALGAEYFLARGDDKLKVLARAPGLREWLNEHGGDEAVMRGFMLAAYRAIPDEWLRRTFRERFPEVFSKEAEGERRLRSVAQSLAENPGLEDFYFRALRLNSQAFIEQLRRGGTPPKPLHYERRRRLARRKRRRAARFSSHWTLHRELRLDIRSGAGAA